MGAFEGLTMNVIFPKIMPAADRMDKKCTISEKISGEGDLLAPPLDPPLVTVEAK